MGRGGGGGEGSEVAVEARERDRAREWEEVADAVAYDSCTWPPPVVAVCGPGNSGKSAFSRLLLNTLVGRYKKVAYLDTDVGQPEFTPPGFVSLHVLEEQAEDFKMLYLRTPKRCFFFGDVCAKKNPKLLLNYIFSLYDYFLKEIYRFDDIDNPQKSAIPLVINTSGWVKGTGLHMLKELLKYASPTHVIQLRTSAKGKNLPTGMFWLDEPEGDSVVNLVEIHAAQDVPRHLLVKKEARVIRDLRLIAYFRQCLPMDFPVFSYNDLIQGFASIEPFQLPMSKIQVIDLHNQVPDNTEHHFLKGTIVGFATSASVPLSNRCSIPCCVGLGFIKDVARDSIHLITPVYHQLLESVDIIFRSCFTVPTCLLQVVSDSVSDITDGL
ncbi:polynucleotide 5'-hydroxyl-kinase NOL9-like [Oryza brachyantha]|uniref:polynucleotide 5'-hydroxyl-kinase NOL9-like n=1 Tax=Oryza brachyantha TaxID=4533 RepID=UPI0007767184|nr:polynucleotide 5'-hydroxyl-kinase NOL9-like [Oryza brachyantha]